MKEGNGELWRHAESSKTVDRVVLFPNIVSRYCDVSC